MCRLLIYYTGGSGAVAAGALLVLLLVSCYRSGHGSYIEDAVDSEGRDTQINDPWLDRGGDEQADREAGDAVDFPWEDVAPEIDAPPVCGDGIVAGGEECDPPGVSGACTSACGTAGTRVCLDGCLWEEGCTPPRETCANGVDDDCDGAIDEVFDLVSDSIIETVDYASSPSIVWTGTEIFLSWFETPDSHTPTGENLFVERFDGGGSPLAPPVFIGSIWYISFPSIAWTGESLLVIWGQEQLPWSLFGYDLMGMRLSASGTPVSDPVLIDEYVEECDTHSPWTGGFYALACTVSPWPDLGNPRLIYRMLSGSLEQIGDLVFLTGLTDATCCPASTWTGSDVIVTWLDSFNGLGSGRFFMTRISTEGEQIMDRIPISPSTLRRIGFHRVWVPGELAFDWCDSTSCWLRRVHADGTPAGEDSRMSCGDLGSGDWKPALSWSGDCLMAAGVCQRGDEKLGLMAGMAWGPEYVFDFNELYRLEPATNPWPGEPEVAWMGSYFAMTWSEEIPGGSEPHLTLLQPACRP